MTLADRIIEYLQTHPLATCGEVALRVRSRRHDVLDVLLHDARIKRESGIGRGYVYRLTAARERSGTIAPRNRASRLYRVLRDREPHTRNEIFTREGFFLTNNAADELRDELEPDGLDVVFDRKHDSYQIVGEVTEGCRVLPDQSAAVDMGHALPVLAPSVTSPEFTSTPERSDPIPDSDVSRDALAGLHADTFDSLGGAA